MHAALHGFFALHDEKTRSHCQSSKAMMAPVVDISNGIERHLLELEHQLQIAELAADDDLALQHNTHLLHTRIQSARARVAEFRRVARELQQALTALPDMLDTGKQDIENVIRLRAGGAPATD